ncbi:MAG: ferric reductase-like transmembrane domain-containing protein [Candidatus Riflebacteria bacterium]|nr:ferric reductase-like transmembrane domain-containing protein [Candidatus Riflebacteria bacterium]
MNKKKIWLVIIFSFFVPVFFWKMNHNSLTSLDSGALSLAFGRLAGLSAAVLLFWQIVFISRAKFIEGKFGLDRLTKYHHSIGFVILFFLILHVTLITFGLSRDTDSTLMEQFQDFWKSWEGLQGAMIGFVLFATATLFSINALRAKFSYERWHLSHLVAYFGIALSFSHQVENGKDFVQQSGLSIYWYVFFGTALFFLLTFRFLRPFYCFFKHKFRVDRITRETIDVTSVYLTGRDLKNFSFKTGQFAIVRFFAPGFRWESHPFSLSLPKNNEFLRLTVRQIGDFTKKIPELPIGTKILVDGPHGIFTSDRVIGKKILLIAGGIGITPIRPLFEELINMDKDTILLYSNRNQENIPLRSELDSLAQYKRAKVIYVITNDNKWTGEKGHLNQEKILLLVPDIYEREIFQCGPPGMMIGLRKAFNAIGLSEDRIYDETFTF